jgi:CheY-like chemotaxis protein
MRKIANQPPDLLITDFHHPGARLAEILGRIGEAPARFPIVVVSACAANNPDLAQAELLSAYPSFATDVLGEPICQNLISAVLKHLAPSDGPLKVSP